MSTELTTHQASTDIAEKVAWSRAIAPATLLPQQYRNAPANLLFAVEYADALGIERINAITSIHVIEGKPSASAELIAGLIRRAGHKLRVTGDDARAVAQLIRADDPEFTYETTWTLDRAKQAGLAGKGVWKNYPAAMLRARAITEVARMGASDALLGVVYTPEELGAEVDANGAPARPAPITAEVAEQPRSAGQRLAAAVQARVASPEPAEDIHDAEVEHDSHPANNPQRTKAQSDKLFALLREIGIGDRDSALAYMTETLGREVTSSKTLTKAEASVLIDALESLTPGDGDLGDGEPA